LFGSRVLSLVEDNEGLIERSSAHTPAEQSQSCPARCAVGFRPAAAYRAARREAAGDTAQFFVKITRQEPERFTGFDGWPGQNNSRDLLSRNAATAIAIAK
jgi:hypothetical protein